MTLDEQHPWDQFTLWIWLEAYYQFWVSLGVVPDRDECIRTMAPDMPQEITRWSVDSFVSEARWAWAQDE